MPVLNQTKRDALRETVEALRICCGGNSTTCQGELDLLDTADILFAVLDSLHREVVDLNPVVGVGRALNRAVESAGKVLADYRATDPVTREELVEALQQWSGASAEAGWEVMPVAQEVAGGDSDRIGDTRNRSIPVEPMMTQTARLLQRIADQEAGQNA